MMQVRHCRSALAAISIRQHKRELIRLRTDPYLYRDEPSHSIATASCSGNRSIGILIDAFRIDLSQQPFPLCQNIFPYSDVTPNFTGPLFHHGVTGPQPAQPAIRASKAQACFARSRVACHLCCHATRSTSAIAISSGKWSFACDQNSSDADGNLPKRSHDRLEK